MHGHFIVQLGPDDLSYLSENLFTRSLNLRGYCFILWPCNSRILDENSGPNGPIKTANIKYLRAGFDSKTGF